MVAAVRRIADITYFASDTDIAGCNQENVNEVGDEFVSLIGLRYSLIVSRKIRVLTDNGWNVRLTQSYVLMESTSPI